MSQNVIQTSFAAGELTPGIWGHVDLAKYRAGAATMRNFFVDFRGGASTRPGTKFVGQCKVSSTSSPPRLIPFQFNVLQSYQLEFGHQYIRFITNGGYILETGVNITNITKASPPLVTAAAHGFSAGDWVYVSGVSGMTQINGRTGIVQNVNANNFTLADTLGGNIDTTAYSNYTANGTAARYYTLASPYSSSDLELLGYTQSADVLTLVHPSYAPRDLTRTGNTAWTLTAISLAPGIAPPSSVTVTANGGGGSYTYAYVVTAATDTEESVASVSGQVAAVALNPSTGAQVKIAWSTVGTATKYNIYKATVSNTGPVPDGALYGLVGTSIGTTFIDNNFAPDFTKTPPLGRNIFTPNAVGNVTIGNGGANWTSNVTLQVRDVAGGGAVFNTTVTNGTITAVNVASTGQNFQNPILTIKDGTGVNATGSFTLADDGTGNGTYQITAVNITAGGAGYGATARAYALDPKGTGAQINVFTAAGAIANNATLTANGTGYQSPQLIITDTGNGTANTSLTLNMNASTNYPATTCYFQQRKVYAGASNTPQTVNLGQPGNYKNFDISTPGRDDDALSLTIASTQVNAVKALVPMSQGLIVLTGSGAWQISGGQQNADLTPTTAQATPQAFNGCSSVKPIVINYDILYVQSRGDAVRDLAYNFYVNVYTGSDITMLSSHLFRDHSVREWAWQEEPFKIVWTVMDSGVLLSLTYLKDQEIYGWSRHDTLGLFRSVSTVVESDRNAVYFVTQRFIRGAWWNYVERLDERRLGANLPLGIPAQVEQAWFVDCGLQYPVSTPNATLTPAAAVGGGNITSGVVVTGGANYSNGTSITVTDPTGTGCVMNLTIANGTVTAAGVVASGSNYTNPTVRLFDPAGTGSGAVVNAIVTNLVNFTADAAVFSAQNVGDVIRINGGKATITAFNSNTSVTANLSTPILGLVPNSVSTANPNGVPLPAASGGWTLSTPTMSVSGLWHLEGQTVSILADGSTQPSVTVTNGTVTLQNSASLITIGLPFQAQLQTLPLDLGGNPTVQGKRKQISAVTARVQDTRGLKWGPDTDNLIEFKQRTNESYGVPIALFTGDQRLVIPSVWTVYGQIIAQQDYPLPATILAVIPEINVGDQPDKGET